MRAKDCQAGGPKEERESNQQGHGWFYEPPGKFDANKLQASPGHVDFAIESHVTNMGEIQRAPDTLLFTCSWFQTVFLHFRR